MKFTAPLSPLTHEFFATRPAASWCAYGESGQVIFLADTAEDWRYAAIQAVHELIEAIFHRHSGVTQAGLDTLDTASLDHGKPVHTVGHTTGAAIETQLALALGLSHSDWSRVIAGRARPAAVSSYSVRQAP